MKKILAFISILSFGLGSLFAENVFSKRYVELKANVPVNISNNVITLNDIMVENVVIDLAKIADEIPEKGMDFSITAKPNIAFKLDFTGFLLGLDAGVDADVSLGIGKGLFDLVGHGYDYTKYDSTNPFQIDLNLRADAFAYIKADIGFGGKKWRFKASPSVFVPVLHVVNKDAHATFTNTDEGDLLAEANAEIAAYAFDEVDKLAGQLDVQDLLLTCKDTLGIDMGASFTYKLSDKFSLWGDLRVPIMPGHLKKSTSVKATANYKGNVQEFINGTFFDSENTGYSITDEAGNDFNFGGGSGVNWAECDYEINRPLKFNGYAKFDLIPDVISLTGGAGFGILNPFAKEEKMTVYPEYYAAVKAGLANIVMLQFSTEYTERVFKHELGLTLNIRLVEVDVGASLQSSDFMSSFKIDGLGAYVTVCVGL